MTDVEMRELVRRLAAAKSKQDVEAALEVCHEQMRLETPALHSVARGRAENRQALTRFFKAFPDYRVTVDRDLIGDNVMVCWGTATMTMTGDRFGVTPTGRRAELPVVIEFRFADGLICYERFLYDLSELCSQSGVSTDGVRRKLFGLAYAGEH